MGVPVENQPVVTTQRETIVSRAVYLAVGYFKKPNDDLRNNLTRQAREYYDSDKNRTATDIAYLLVRHFQANQQELLG
jgi:hypothetical protein